MKEEQDFYNWCLFNVASEVWRLQIAIYRVISANIDIIAKEGYADGFLRLKEKSYIKLRVMFKTEDGQIWLNPVYNINHFHEETLHEFNDWVTEENIKDLDEGNYVVYAQTLSEEDNGWLCALLSLENKQYESN